MCMVQELLPDGTYRDAQSPMTEMNNVEYQKQLLQIGKHFPHMSLGDLAKRLDKSVWWLFQRLLSDTVDHRCDLRGVRFLTQDSRMHTVDWMDGYAVRWQGGYFSTHETLKQMVRG